LKTKLKIIDDTSDYNYILKLIKTPLFKDQDAWDLLESNSYNKIIQELLESYTARINTQLKKLELNKPQ